MKLRFNPLVIAMSLATSTISLAAPPTGSQPDAATIQYEGGEANFPIIEEAGSTGKHNLIIKNVQFSDIDNSALESMSTPAVISLGGNNGSFGGNSNMQKYGDLNLTVDSATHINVTADKDITGLYSRTDSHDGTSTVNNEGTLNISSTTGKAIGVGSYNFSDSSGNGSGGLAKIILGQHSDITVAGATEAIGASVAGDNTNITTEKGSQITINTLTNSSIGKGISIWAYNGTSDATINGDITINSANNINNGAIGIDITADKKSSITLGGKITINDGGTITGINANSNTSSKVITKKDSHIKLTATNNNDTASGISTYGNTFIQADGNIEVTGNRATGIRAMDGKADIIQSGNIQINGINSATGIQVLSSQDSYIRAYGNIDVATTDGIANGIYVQTAKDSTIIYNNSLGHITSSAAGSSGGASAITTYSIADTANIAVQNGDYFSATATDPGLVAFTLFSASYGKNASITVQNTNRIEATAVDGHASAIATMASNSTENSQIGLNNINLITAKSGGIVQTIASINDTSGDAVIEIGNTVANIISETTGKGTNSSAIYANANEGDTRVFSFAKQVTALGDTNNGITAQSEKGNVNIQTTSNINASGSNSSAIFATTNEGLNDVAIIGSNVQGGTGSKEQASAILMKSTSGEQKLTIANANISSLNDSAIYSENATGKTTIETNSIITGYSTIKGNDVTFNNLDGTLDLQNFSSGSKGVITNIIGNAGTGTFNNDGIIKFSDKNFDGSKTEAIFEVANFYNNSNGIIDLIGKNPLGKNNLVGDTFTIKGNYISNGGSIYLNTLLDDASSNNGQGTSDLLQVTGDVTTGTGGATRVYITPTANSLGALTSGDGIKVVDVKGTSSANAFTLGRPVTAGAYEYLLGKGSTNENWYLSSFYNPTTGGGGNSGTGQIMYSPSVGAYLANQTAAVEMFQQSLFDRLIAASGFDHDASKPLFWLRTSMTHGSRRSVQANFSNRNRSYMMQMGGDLGVWQVNNGYLHVGLMAGYGDAKNTSTSRLTRTEADGKVKGYSTGIYGTWFANQDTNLGLYIDTWSQMGWYRNEVSGEAQISTKKYNSTVWSNSVEAGYGISLGKAVSREWIATPQVQLTYNSYDADNQTDKNNLHTSNNQASGLASRTGIRLHARGLQKKTIEPFVEMNWLHNTAKNQLTFNGDKLRDGLPQNRFEAKVGLQGDINDKWSVSAQVGGQWGQNHFNQYQGQLNVNYKW